MNDIQQKLFDLLTDLDDICTREGIRYYLCEETALAAQVRGNFFKSCLQASVAMTPQDALRFAAAVKKAKRPDRAADSMLNNKHYPNFTMLYSDPNTMMIRLPLHKEAKKPCVGVTIQMIRHQPKRFGAIGNYITKFWKVCCKPAATVGGTFRHTVVAICNGMQRIFGTLLSGTLFRLWGAMYGAGNHSKRISICSDTFQYPAGPPPARSASKAGSLPPSQMSSSILPSVTASSMPPRPLSLPPLPPRCWPLPTSPTTHMSSV